MARFNLKNKKDDPALILCIVRIRGERFVYSTSLKVPLRYWDDDRQRVKSPHLYRPGKHINDVLNRMSDAADEFYLSGMASGNWDWEELRHTFDVITMRVGPSVELSLVAFIRQAKANRAGQVKPNTVKIYDALVMHLEGWERKHRDRIAVRDVDMAFFYSFRDYLTEKGLGPNTLSKYIKRLRSFLGEADEMGLEVPPDYKSKRFSVATVETSHIYLTEADLSKLERAELPDEHMRPVRDLFLVACRTGLRYSDWWKIKPENIRDIAGQQVLDIRATKTDRAVLVPVHPFVSAMLERYGGMLPTFSNPYFNRMIKEVCRAAKVDRFDQVSAHTARRTFATLLFLAGVAPLEIARMTGHTTEKSLLTYLRMSGEEVAVRVGRLWNEKGPE